MQSFLQLRDGLQCLASAMRLGQPYPWLQACADVRLSLVGEQGRRPALPEIGGLLSDMQTHLQQLAQEHPRFGKSLTATCEMLAQHEKSMHEGMEEALSLLTSDALIEVWLNALKKHDWLGHRPCLPQALPVLWRNHERRQRLHALLQGLYAAVMQMDELLNDYVVWDQRLAEEGSDQIIPDRSKRFGLIIIGLRPEQVDRGVVPDVSGNHLVIRLRFQLWSPGLPAKAVQEDVPYCAMLVPVA